MHHTPVVWFWRRVRHLRLALILCIVVTYCMLFLVSFPVFAYFERIQSVDRVLKADDLSQIQKDSPSGRFFVAPREVDESTTETKNFTIRQEQVGNLTLLRKASTKTSFQDQFASWGMERTSICGNLMHLYGRQFAHLRKAIIDRRFCVSRARGGEEIRDVLNQDEQAEYYQVTKDCFQLACDDLPYYYRFKGLNYLNDWLTTMKRFDVHTDEDINLEPGFTIVLMRREYANLYHTVNEWYNVYLLMKFFQKLPNETNILLLDAHPKGNLDSAWPVLFNSTRLLSAMPQRTQFEDMVWGIQGYNSILKDSYFDSLTTPPLLEEFRRFFLSRFHLNDSRPLNCANLSVLFIWRHDYLAHPRNPSGLVQRKIYNEEELLTSLRSLHRNYTIRGVQIDSFTMRDQLRLVTEADILVGMHGAGLSHTLFVPPHGGLIELVPHYYGSNNYHFIDMAKWRGLAQLRWINRNSSNELHNFQTRVPVEVMNDLLQRMATQICSESQQNRLEANRHRVMPRSHRINYTQILEKRRKYQVKYNFKMRHH